MIKTQSVRRPALSVVAATPTRQEESHEQNA